MCSLGDVKRRTGRLVFVIRVEGRVDIVSTYGELVVKVFGREEEASNGEKLRCVRRDGGILGRTIKWLYFRRVSRGHVIVDVKGNGLVRVVHVRGLIRCVNARRCYFQSDCANVLGFFGFQVTLRRVIGGHRSTPFSSRQAISSANGI